MPTSSRAQGVGTAGAGRFLACCTALCTALIGWSASASAAAAASADEQPGTPVAFRVTAVTEWGDQLFVVGSVPELGSWAPDRAVPASAAQYPDWTTRVQTHSVRVEFKYIVKKPDGSVVWEAGGNRLLEPQTGRGINTADRFRTRADTPASGTAPTCITWSDSWRYTEVDNACGADYRLQVLFADGSTSTCNPVAASAYATFPGYGTAENRVVAMRHC
ncbi:carbohydrate-binding module family 20 domain-containing protein [Streptomyces sp. NPDC059104]|uniref:carbohydrate-binding module family 20 domain-containing protein n=1 Tax=Streptomyces sp. NPDC059104 TaxID=3346729 RepID=UPI00369CA6A4